MSVHCYSSPKVPKAYLDHCLLDLFSFAKCKDHCVKHSLIVIQVMLLILCYDPLFVGRVAYSDWLWAGLSGDRILVGGEIFRACPGRPWGPPSLLYNRYQVFPGGKERPGHDTDPSPPSSAVVHERVEQYLYSPYGPYGLYRASVPVQGCTLPFYDPLFVKIWM